MLVNFEIKIKDKTFYIGADGCDQTFYVISSGGFVSEKIYYGADEVAFLLEEYIKHHPPLKGEIYDLVMAEIRKLDDDRLYNNRDTLRNIVEVWEAGLEGEVPVCLEKYAEQAALKEDPEWAEYIRLKEKFKGVKE